jgi:hypothetical protein
VTLQQVQALISALDPGSPDLSGFMPVTGGTFTGAVSVQNATVSANPVTLGQMNATLTSYVANSGGTMTGPLYLNANATNPLSPVPLQQLTSTLGGYVTTSALTTALAPYMPFTGGTFTGAVTLAGNATANNQPVTLSQMNAAIAAGGGGGGTPNALPLSGGTMTGPIVLAGNATGNLNPVPLQQLNAMLVNYATTTQLSNFLPISGGTLTGNLNVPTLYASNAIFWGTRALGANLYTASGPQQRFSWTSGSGMIDADNWFDPATGTRTWINWNGPGSTPTQANSLMGLSPQNAGGLLTVGAINTNYLFMGATPDLNNNNTVGIEFMVSGNTLNARAGSTSWLQVVPGGPNYDIGLLGRTYITQKLTVAGELDALAGIRFGSGTGANVYQFLWDGTVVVYIDGNYVGRIALSP